MITPPSGPRLLAGPPPTAGPESIDAHLARLGPLPDRSEVRHLIPVIEATGLLGRGGAGFPVGRKWRALAERREGSAVVVANGAEGEPASRKDRVLMVHRPHLVVDGAVLAAEAIGADEIVFYVGREHVAAVASLRRAIDERAADVRPPMRLVEAPVGYVAGEATAAVHYINSADARPTTTPPRMSASGVGGLPTLVQNVESLAYVALIARFGDWWYRSAGRGETRGTALVTVSGPVEVPGVREIEIGTPLGEVVEAAGGVTTAVGAVAVGGYFGTWAHAEEAWGVPLDHEVMKARGLTFGCGMIGLLPADACGVTAAAQIMSFMARESARQCGPCLYGLAALGDASARIAHGAPAAKDPENVERWIAQVAGRGACRHPDGAAQMMATALDTFGDDYRSHVRTGRCLATGASLRVA